MSRPHLCICHRDALLVAAAMTAAARCHLCLCHYNAISLGCAMTAAAGRHLCLCQSDALAMPGRRHIEIDPFETVADELTHFHSCLHHIDALEFAADEGCAVGRHVSLAAATARRDLCLCHSALFFVAASGPMSRPHLCLCHSDALLVAAALTAAARHHLCLCAMTAAAGRHLCLCQSDALAMPGSRHLCPDAIVAATADAGRSLECAMTAAACRHHLDLGHAVAAPSHAAHVDMGPFSRQAAVLSLTF